MTHFGIGETAKLIKKTHLYRGIFIIQNSQVEIASMEPANDNPGAVTYTVIYRDREGNPVPVSGILPTELTK